MSDPRPFGEAEFLTLRIGGHEGDPERLLLIGRPRDATVRVREWTSNSWTTGGEDFDADPAALLDDIARAWDARRPVSEEMYRVRLWLTGQG